MTIRLSEYRCPYCGSKTDAATMVEAMDKPIMPRPGDFSVCICCAGILVFSQNGTVRKPTEQELEEAKVNPSIRQIRRTIIMMGLRN